MYLKDFPAVIKFQKSAEIRLQCKSWKMIGMFAKSIPIVSIF